MSTKLSTNTQQTVGIYDAYVGFISQFSCLASIIKYSKTTQDCEGVFTLNTLTLTESSKNVRCISSPWWSITVDLDANTAIFDGISQSGFYNLPVYDYV